MTEEDIFDRWENFSKGELLSPDGLFLLDKKGVFTLRIEAVDKLQKLRNWWRDPIRVNIPGHVRRGWRSPEENRRIYEEHRLKQEVIVGGVSMRPEDNRFSFHIAGVAFDCSVDRTKDLDAFAKLAKEVGFKGIIHYNTFLHIDLRDGEYFELDRRG